jgi:hypothetical protein
MIDVPQGDLDTWLAELKPYQRDTLAKFTSTMTAEAAAEKWLTTIGSPNIAGFGGGTANNSKPYWERFKAECNKFICDDTAYVDEKKNFLNELPISKPVLISAMSGAIGASLGAAGTLVAPAVTLILFTVGSIGRKAYCST